MVDTQTIRGSYRLLVLCTGDGARATLQACSSESDSRQVRCAELWVDIESRSAYIGRRGCGKSREGDSKTPLGEFGVRGAFGIKPNPGTQLPYLSIGESTYAVDEPGQYYDRIVDSPEPRGGEHMIAYPQEYAYGLDVDYNHDREYPLGSAIFVHCKGPRPYTGGCIAVDEDFMVRILKVAGPDFKVLIRENLNQ